MFFIWQHIYDVSVLHGPFQIGLILSHCLLGHFLTFACLAVILVGAYFKIKLLCLRKRTKRWNRRHLVTLCAKKRQLPVTKIMVKMDQFQ